MAYLSFYLALEAEAEAETTSTEVKENLEAEVAAAVEPLSSTLTLKGLMIIIQAATYTYQLALAELAAKAGTDFPPEALEGILLQSLKTVMVRRCIQLHVAVAKVAPATPETQRPIQLAAQAVVFGLPVTTTPVQQF